jgi:hypothetical protein
MVENVQQNAILFIPDISGFTKFVNESELSHSQHIIHELLEIILDANKINLSVSEIEGDAILFYKIGVLPSLVELSEQIKNMFIKFHEQLQIIERDRICHCGACSTAINLTLKFLTHSGEITESKIKKHKKLMGKDVIVAHRLLKNNIESVEYSLVTEKYLKAVKDKDYETHFNWAEIQSGIMNYEHIGDVSFKYINLSPLKKLATISEKKELLSKYPNPILKNIFINVSKEIIYRTIIDLGLRPEWTNGLLNIEYKENEIPKIGTSHKCEFEQGLFEIETVYSQKKENTLEIAERTNNNFLFPQATTNFILDDDKNGTMVQIEVHYKRNFILGKLIDILFRSKFEDNISKSLSNLKIYCENKFLTKTQKQ